jgi:hypothetical protein
MLLFLGANPAIRCNLFCFLSPRAQSRDFRKNKKGFSLLSGLIHSEYNGTIV